MESIQLQNTQLLKTIPLLLRKSNREAKDASPENHELLMEALKTQMLAKGLHGH